MAALANKWNWLVRMYFFTQVEFNVPDVRLKLSASTTQSESRTKNPCKSPLENN